MTTIDGARETLELIAGRRSGMTTATQNRDAARTILDALASAEEVLAGADHTAAKYWRKMRDAEREMHARELHHFEEEQKSAGLAAVIERVRSLLPGPHTFAETMSRDFAGNLWPRTVDADILASVIGTDHVDALRAVKAETLREAADAIEKSASSLSPHNPGELAYINCTRIDARELRLRADQIEKGEQS